MTNTSAPTETEATYTRAIATISAAAHDPALLERDAAEMIAEAEQAKERHSYNDETTFNVWVSTFGLYNSGTLSGYWIAAEDAPQTVDQFAAGLVVRGIRFDAREIGEELHSFDTENAPEAGEMSPARALELAEFLATVDDDDRAIFTAWASDEMDAFTAEGLERFHDSYRGYFEENSEQEAVAESMAELFQESELPEWAQPHYWDLLRIMAQDDMNGGAYNVQRFGNGYAVYSN
jgi:hypothetical protein